LAGYGENFHVWRSDGGHFVHVPIGTGGAAVVDALWDDAAFKKRVQALAKTKGLSMRAALEAAGITHRYFSRPQEGRSTNLLLNLAKTLDVSPAELFGVAGAAPAEMPLPVDSEKLKRITVAARMMTAQIAALVYVACDDGAGVDPCELMRQVMDRVLDGDHSSSSSDGNGK
jgi:transcriptional regulator with XRE-family HTH domain